MLLAGSGFRTSVSLVAAACGVRRQRQPVCELLPGPYCSVKMEAPYEGGQHLFGDSHASGGSPPAQWGCCHCVAELELHRQLQGGGSADDHHDSMMESLLPAICCSKGSWCNLYTACAHIHTLLWGSMHAAVYCCYLQLLFCHEQQVLVFFTLNPSRLSCA